MAPAHTHTHTHTHTHNCNKDTAVQCPLTDFFLKPLRTFDSVLHFSTSVYKMPMLLSSTHSFLA